MTSQKIRQITNWDLKKKIKFGKNFLANKYSNNLIDKKYDVLYDREFYLDKKITKPGKIKNLIFNFYLIQKSKIFHLFCILFDKFYITILFLILAVIVNKNSLAAEIGIVSGFWITFTQIYQAILE